MRSRRLRLLSLATLLTAALIPGAAVFVRPAYACGPIQVTSPVQLVPESEVIVIGKVVSADQDLLVFKPEAFLKGPASADDMRLVTDDSGCPLAPLRAGDRALIYIARGSQPVFPYSNQAFTLKDGRALSGGSESLSEAELVSQVRALTGQYAVPAVSSSEGAGIDWNNTVVPLAIALGIIFAIGLVLMRTWHRIDPS